MIIKKIKAYIPFLCIAVICSIALCFGLVWVCLLFLTGTVFLYISFHGIEKMKASGFKNSVQLVLVMVFIFIGTIAFRLFVLDIYTIPSESMRDTLKKGHVILVNKLLYGSRIPESIDEVPWLNVFSYFGEKKIKSKKGTTSKRFAGVSEIRRKDVLVFELEKRRNKKTIKETLVKRCIGLPGDTVSIKNGEVFVNDKIVMPTPETRYRFKIRLDNHIDFVKSLSDFGIQKKDILKKEGDSIYVLASIATIQKVKKAKEVSTAEVAIDEIKEKQHLLGKSKNQNWTLDNMGPIVIPGNGVTIEITPYNYALYQRVLRIHEGVNTRRMKRKMTESKDNYQKYVFKRDYYFMMGDNRKKSMDSRMFGFIPKDAIIGKVQTIISTKK